MALAQNPSRPVGHLTAFSWLRTDEPGRAGDSKQKAEWHESCKQLWRKGIRAEMPVRASDTVIAEGNAKGQYVDRQSCS